MLNRFVATFTVALLLGACGSPPTGGTQDATDAIALAADAMRDAGSMSFTMDMSMSGEGFSMDISGEGAADMVAQRMHMEMDVPGFPGVQPGEDSIEMRMIDNYIYIKTPSPEDATGSFAPGETRTWMRMDVSETGGTFGDPFSSSDPTAMADFLRGISDDVETVGREEIRGHMTTHYRAEVSLEKALEHLPQEQRDTAGAQLENFKDQFGLNSMPVEVWIDDEGLLWRQTMDMEFGEGRMTMSFDVLEYDVEVNVEKPPADEVFDGPAYGASTSGSSFATTEEEVQGEVSETVSP